MHTVCTQTGLPSSQCDEPYVTLEPRRKASVTATMDKFVPVMQDLLQSNFSYQQEAIKEMAKEQTKGTSNHSEYIVWS